MMHHYTEVQQFSKYHLDKHSLTFWTFAVTLSLNTAIQFYHTKKHPVKWLLNQSALQIGIWLGKCEFTFWTFLPDLLHICASKLKPICVIDLLLCIIRNTARLNFFTGGGGIMTDTLFCRCMYTNTPTHIHTHKTHRKTTCAQHTHVCMHARTHTHTHTHTNTHTEKLLSSHHSLLCLLAAAVIDPHGQVMDQSQPLGNLDLLLLSQLTGWTTDIRWRVVDGDYLGFLQGDEWEDLLQKESTTRNIKHERPPGVVQDYLKRYLSLYNCTSQVLSIIIN